MESDCHLSTYKITMVTQKKTIFAIILINKRFPFPLTISGLIQCRVQNVDCHVLFPITAHQRETWDKSQYLYCYGDVRASRGIALHKLLYYALIALSERAYNYVNTCRQEWFIICSREITLYIMTKEIYCYWYLYIL